MIMSTERTVTVTLDLTVFDVPQLVERLRESDHPGVLSDGWEPKP